MASTGFKAHTQILECLISLILSVEIEFEPFSREFLPVLLDCVESSDWNTRKMAIDCMYTMAAILNDVIIPFKKQILGVLNQCRFDKMKPVREATVEAMNMIKEIGPPVDESDAGTQGSRR
jgi:hypothetical protein